MPQTATETALPDRETIAKVALKAYNTWAGLPTLQQMSFNHPSLGEMIADAVLAASPQPSEVEVEWGVREPGQSVYGMDRYSSEESARYLVAQIPDGVLYKHTVTPWVAVQS